MRKAAALIMAIVAIAVGVTVGNGTINHTSQSQAVCTAHSTQQQCLPGLVAQDRTAQFFPLAQQYVTWTVRGTGYVHSDLHLY